MSRQRVRLAIVFAVAAVLALATWQLQAPWWAWPLYGAAIGSLLTLAGRADGSGQR